MSSQVMHLQTCGSGCAPRSPRPSRKPTSSCSPPCPATTTPSTSTRSSRQAPFSRAALPMDLLSASVISAAIANKLPGPGSIYVSQSLRFRAPVRANDTVRATVTVKEMIPVRFRVLLTTVCTVGGLVVIEGEAVVALPAPSLPEYLSPVAFEKEAALV